MPAPAAPGRPPWRHLQACTLLVLDAARLCPWSRACGMRCLLKQAPAALRSCRRCCVQAELVHAECAVFLRRRQVHLPVGHSGSCLENKPGARRTSCSISSSAAAGALVCSWAALSRWCRCVPSSRHCHRCGAASIRTAGGALTLRPRLAAHAHPEGAHRAPVGLRHT